MRIDSNLLRMVFSLFVLLALAFPAKADVIYTVEKGDNAWAIAARFGIGLDDLYLANGWAEDEEPLLQIGQRIVIPTEREEPIAVDTPENTETESTPENSVPSTTYQVQHGDNPYIIAHKFGIGTVTLLEFNGLNENSVIHPGQVLKIPSGAVQVPVPDEAEEIPEEPQPEPLRYRVEPGDNMWTIARKFSVNMQKLLSFNNLTENSVLQIGTEILIPVESNSLTSRSLGWTDYTVIAGDTISGIAVRHGVSPVAIFEANGLTAQSTLHPGQKIKLPGYRPETPPVENENPDNSLFNLAGNSEAPVEVTPLPGIGGTPIEIAAWHSEMFDFREISLPEPSTPAAGVPDKGNGFSVDGYFSDGTPWHRYTIRRGDTIGEVARAFGITQSELMNRNGLDIRSPLRIGRDLKISLPKQAAPPRPNNPGSQGSGRTTGRAKGTIGSSPGTPKGVAVVQEAMKYLGTPYVWGGTSLTGGCDCSGFTTAVMKLFGVSLNRRSRDQANDGVEVSYNELRPGDIVLFTTTRSGISHAGIYIGGGEFIHSSSHRGGVVISPMDSGYYRERFVMGRRVIN